MRSSTPVSDQQTIFNDAVVYSDTVDRDTSNNLAHEATLVQASADLRLSKAAIGSPVAGSLFHYEILVHNDGSSVSRDVTLRDMLPDGLTLVSAYVDTGGSLGNVPLACTTTVGSNFVFCPLGDIPPTGAVPVIIVLNVMVDPSVPDGTILTNVADVLLTDTPDPNLSNNRDDADVVSSTAVSIRTLKIAQPPDPVAGTQFSYEISVTNDGPSDAIDLLVRDVLPADVTYVASTDACVEVVPGTIECRPAGTAGSTPPYVLPAGESVSFTVVVDLDAAASGPIVNQTETTTGTPNATITDIPSTILPRQVADLKVSKFVSPHTPVLAGEQFTYTILVDNLGPSRADNVIITDTLISSGLVDVNGCSIFVRTDGGAISEFDCNFVPSTGLIDLGTIGANWLNPRSPTDLGRVEITFNLTADEPIDLTNTTTVTSDAEDPNPANNMAMVAHSVLGVADLELILPCVPNPVDAGATTVCTFTSRNNGPSSAINTRIDVRLPVEVDVLDVTGFGPNGAAGCTAGTPGNPADPTVCQFGTLLVGEEGTMNVTLLIDPDTVVDPVTDLRELQADAVTSSDTLDIDFSNNVGFEPITVLAAADLAIQKTAVGVPVAGELFHYEILIDNLGPGVSRDVTLRDFLPTGVHLVTGYVDAENQLGGIPQACHMGAGAGEVLCPLGDIPPTNGAPIRVILDVLIDPGVPDGTPLDNVADVLLTDTPDPDLANNVDNALVNAISRAELEVVKTGERLDPVAGTRHRFWVEVTNHGPSDAFNLLVADTLPQGFNYVKDSDTCTEVAPGVLECRPAGAAPDYILPAGETVRFEILVEIDPSVVCNEMRINTACATADNADMACGSARMSIECVADLRIRKYGKPDDEVRADETLTYTLIVDNLGPSFTAPVMVTDTAISNGEFFLVGIIPDVTRQFNASCDYRAIDPVSGTPVAQGNVAAGGGIPAPIGPLPGFLELTCVNNGRMQIFGPNADPADGPGRWIIQYVLRADDAQSINNVASVSGIDPDPDPSNNESAVQHDILDVADLEVSKTSVGNVVTDGCPPVVQVMPDMVTAGELISWTVTVTNTGPSMAENVKILDRLPPWIVVTDYEIEGGGSCKTGAPNNPLDQLTCGFGKALATTATASAAVTITARVDPSTPAGTVLENDVMVMADPFDNNNANNFDSSLSTVKTAADLRIEKMDMPDPVKAGQALYYTLRVTNDGPSDAMFVVVTDTLPAEVDFVSAAPTKLSKVGGGCMENKGVVRCGLGTIPAGHFAEVRIEVAVKPDAVPPGQTQTTITNSAVVSSMTPDPCPTNNMVDEPTTVQRLSEVYVVKTDDPDPVAAGGVLTYTVTFGNRGPSTATNVTVVDVLPAGLTFLHCAPQTPGNQVSCAEGPAGTITLEEIESGGAVVWNDVFGNALNDLDPGESYSFQIVAMVDPGYVLDGLGDTGPGEACEALADATGYPHYAHNRVTITAAFFDMMNGVPAVQTHVHDECTRVEGLADLKIEKTDIFGDPAANPDNWFLECDPVEPGGMITYMLTVMNMGPSDAAQVVVMDWLPERFVAVDPAQVMIEIEGGAGVIEEVRDTGKITLVIGNDDGVIGRLNAGNAVKVTIRVMVRQDAICGGLAVNRAMVGTRALVGPPAITSPTPDRDLTNNEAVEETKIECPDVEVTKTVSFDGTCPGVDGRTVNLVGQAVTFCYEILNTGTTYLDEIRITDTLRTRREMWPTVIFTDVIRYADDPKIPVPPGARLLRQVTIPSLSKECGTATNVVEVVANPVNSGRTDLPCLMDVTDSDSLTVDVPCAGLDWRLQLPKLDTETCETWIQVQNVGGCEPTMALMVAWGDAGFCPPQAAGPLKAECSGLIRPGAAWSFAGSQIPAGAKSAVVYSLSGREVEIEGGGWMPFGRLVCEEFFFGVVGDDFEWARFDGAYRRGDVWEGLDLATYRGQPLAASVNRACPDPMDPNVTNHAAYTGISSDLAGAFDPETGAYSYYAPMLFASRGDLNSMINIQSAGLACSSLELWFMAQDNCLRPVLGDVLQLAPGETIMFDPNTVVGPDWLGSAWIRASQPLGIVVDTHGVNHFTSYAGLPADVYELDFTFGNQVNYAPLIYSEYQGWDTAIQVQNLSAYTPAKVKVYFLDRAGGVITTLVDWVCPRGSQTFFLPVLANLPGGWVGSARVESQEWWAPGQPLVQPPRVSSVVLLERWSDPARTSRREAVAYNAQTECLLYDWQIAPGTKGGTSSGSAVFAIPLVAKGNRGITSEIGITNLVPKPGFTDFVMYFYDQNGLVDYACQKLTEKQVEYIDLNTWGAVPQGYLGSMVVSAVFWEHDVFDGQGRFERNLVGLGAVAVERIGGTQGAPDVPGDESKAFEAIPLFDHFCPVRRPNCPGVSPLLRP